MTQGWFKCRPTKAFKISANVSVLWHNVPNSRGIGSTWTILKYACTRSTVCCSSHYVPRRIVTYITITTPHGCSVYCLRLLHESSINCIWMALVLIPGHRMLERSCSHFAVTLYGSTYRCTLWCPAPCELMGLIRDGSQSGCTQTWSTSPARPFRTLPTDPVTCTTYVLVSVPALPPFFIFTVYLLSAIMDR